MNLLKDLKIMTWAAMHHYGFRYCQILFPVRVDFWTFGGDSLRITITWQLPKIDIPWDVYQDFERANKRPIPPSNWDYDDIPF